MTSSKTTQIEGSFHGTDIQYGYLWWLDIGNPLFTYLDDENTFLAMSTRGQRIFISPDLDAVKVITADERDESQCDILIRYHILVPLIPKHEIKSIEELRDQDYQAGSHYK